MMKIAIACDHGAVDLKNALVAHLEGRGFVVTDFGTHTTDSCDYPDVIAPAARAVANGQCDRGIVLCTTGIGVSIVANKIKGIRCALLFDPETARITRQHNDTNMMALGAKSVTTEVAKQIADNWLDTPFSFDERHCRRISKLMALEE